MLAAAAAGTVTSFPSQLSLFCGAGGYSSVNAAEFGTAAINGDFTVKNYGAGSALPYAPYGKSAGLTCSVVVFALFDRARRDIFWRCLNRAGFCSFL